MAFAPPDYPPTLPSKPGLLRAPEWYQFELNAWPIGESIRQSFLKHPALKRDQAILEAIAKVVEHANLRRGRQSFVMTLGFVGASVLAPRLAAFLDDPDIDGQVIDTLIKMKAPGYATKIQPHLHAEHSWKRKLAKRYLERFPSA